MKKQESPAFRRGEEVKLCTYEPVAIFSGGRLPTITRLSCRWPILGQAIVWGLCWHFAAAHRPAVRRGGAR